MLFQFLIGRLNTIILKCRKTGTYLFQFLIGRLNTHQQERYLEHQQIVSIPYRQAKYGYIGYTDNDIYGGFNSLQVG